MNTNSLKNDDQMKPYMINVQNKFEAFIQASPKECSVPVPLVMQYGSEESVDTSAPSGIVEIDIHATKRRNLFFSTVCANFSTMAAGNAMAWSSPSIPNMMDQGLIDEYEAAWLTSMLAVGASIGPFLAYRLVESFGRKKLLILDMVLLIFSWVLLGLAPSIAPHLPVNTAVDGIQIMYVARFFSGISVGCIFMVTPMYIAEIADTRVRSALGSLFTLFLIFGYLVEYSIGPYFSSTVLVLVSFISPITCLTIFCTVLPESPLYLMGKGEREAATSALQWLRRREDVSDEIKEIEVSLEESRTTDLVSWSQLLTTRGHLKCLYYVITLILFQQLSGVTVILFYSEPILKMTSSDLSPAVGTILLAVVYMLASFWAPGLTAKFGIKRLLVLSSIGCCFFLGALAFYFYLDQVKVNLDSFKWVPVACNVLYFSFHSIGLSSGPWALMGEFYSPSIKAKSSALTASFCWMFVFILSKLFPPISISLGPAICFAVFSAFCFVCTLYIVILLPDTSGMSLFQIQKLLYEGKK
uniref:Facilitated trehalose transporter Tret1 n=1 Tax=Cacopsylla melanoneura TaxID=428564 RepID=A0A8D8RQ41_9HEMI